MDIDSAIEVFVNAFCKGKSRTHPFVAERIDGIWVMRDTPGKKGYQRRAELVSHGASPSQVENVVAELGLAHYFLADIHASDQAAARRTLYKSAGYRAMGTQWLFVSDLAAIPDLSCEPPVRRIDDEMAARIPQVASQRRRCQPGNRDYAIWDEERDFGWVTSVPYGDSSWVSGLHVMEGYRNQGYGAALMSAMLKEDKSHGIRHSVLLSSRLGSYLYPKLGYRELATLQLFSPARLVMHPRTPVIEAKNGGTFATKQDSQ